MNAMVRRLVLDAVWILLVGAVAASPAAAQTPFAAVPLTAWAPAAGDIPVSLKGNVLTVIPDDAYGFAVVSDFDKNRDAVEGLLRKLKIPFDGTREYADFNDFLERLEGWDSKAPHAAAVLQDAGGGPELVLIIPVTDYKKFATSVGAKEPEQGVAECELFGEVSLIAEKANYALLSERSNRALLEEMLNSKKSVAAACEPIRAWLGKQQAAGVVLPVSIQAACDEILKQLEEAKTGLAEHPPEEIAPYIPMIELLRQAAVRVVTAAREDLTHITFAVRVDDKSGVAASGQAVFKPAGKFAAIMKDGTPLPADCLRNLPSEQFVMSMAYAYPQSLLLPYLELIDDVLSEAEKLDDPPVDVGKLREVIRESAKMANQIHFISQVQSTAGPGLYDGVYGIYHVDDAAALMKINEKLVKQFFDSFEKFHDKLGGIQFGNRKVGEIDALEISIDMLELMKAFGAPEQPGQDAMMKAMFGGEGKLTIYVAAATKDKVVMSYGEAGLKKIVESVKSDAAGLADDVMIKKSAAMLPSDLTMVGYVDLGGYIEMVKKMMAAAMAAQGAAFPLPIPPFPDAPPVGYSLKARGNTAQLDVVVPLELMESTRDFVIQMQGLVGALR